jgi:hypothetical protein
MPVGSFFCFPIAFRTCCVPRIGDENGATVTLSTPKPVAPLNPQEINPGLTPGMSKPPQAQ